MPRFPKGSPEAKAWAAKMRQARKKALPSPEPEEVDIPALQDLIKQVNELKAQMAQQGAQRGEGVVSTPQVNFRGGLVGTYEKYIVDPAYYPNPIERLSQEARLQQFAFPMNYELDFQVSTTQYETKDGVHIKEPRFVVELRRIVRDEETGEPTGGRYIIRRLTFHEDPDAAMTIAREQGLEVDSTNERHFLNEMRYLRMRDWLLETFFPTKPKKVQNKKEMVVGNRLVEYFEVSSTDSEVMPFDRLKTKL